MARKVNTKFLLILTIVIACAVVGGGGLYYWRHHHKDPKALLAIAVQSEKEGKLFVSAQHYFSAGQLMKDTNLMVKGGDLFNRLVYEDEANLGKAQQCWELALSTDPGCKPALQRLLTHWRDFLRIQRDKPTPRTYDNIRDVAAKILKIDPQDKSARAAGPITVIDGWAHGIETNQTAVDKAVKDLIDLQKDDPANPEIPFYIAAAYATQADRAFRASKTTEGEKLSKDARGVMEEAVKNNPSSARFHLMAARIYLSEPVPEGKKENQLQKLQRVRDEAQKAAQLVKTDDPDYDDIMILYATTTAQAVDPENAPAVAKAQADAEKIYRDVLKQRPNDLAARLRLSDFLSTKIEGRDEAIELLANPPPPAPDQCVGPRGLLVKDMEAQALSSVTNMRLDRVFMMKSKSEQEAALPQIEADYRKLEAKAPDNPYVLRLKAKIQIARNQTTDAVTTLSRALAKADRDQIKYELMYLSAKCFIATNQIGTAKSYLQQIVDAFDRNDQARILLAQTELKESDFAGAEANLAKLEQRMPDNIEVIRMRIAVLQQQKKTDEARKVYDKLPEDTRARQLDKATIAMLMGLNEESKRLLDAVAQENPGDVEAALMLSGVYSRDKDTPAALAAIDRAIKAKPDNSDLLLERARLSGGTAEELLKIRMADAEKIKDPLERELTLFSLTRGNPDENIPLGHLKAAEQVKPDDARVLTGMFEYHLGHRNWDKASDYVKRLSDINADKVNGALFRWRIVMSQAFAEADSGKRKDILLKALDFAQQLTHDRPEFAQSWICLGQSQQALGQFEDAVPNFNNAKERQPNNAEAYRGLIDCYYQLKRPDDAGRTIKEAINAVRTAPEFKEMQLQHEMAYGQPENVIANREQAVKDAPDSPAALMSLGQAYASVARVKGAKPATEKEADQWLEKSRAIMAKGAEKFPDQIQFTVVYASLSQLLKKSGEGEKLWKTTLGSDPWKDKPQAISAFADFYARDKRMDEAEKVLRTYLSSPAGKNNVFLTLKLADLLSGQNKIDDALAVIDSIPGDPALQTRKIDLLITQGKLSDAEQLIKSMLDKKPTPSLKASLAYVYLNSNRTQEAKDLLNKLIADNPALTTAYYFRALATLRSPQANPADAIADLTQVRDSTPDNIQARYVLADCYARIGDPDNAMREYEGIVRVSPAAKQARMVLMDMYSQTSPPRWLDAERVAREGEALPELAQDIDFLAAEARLYSRGDPGNGNKSRDAERAVRYATQAMKLDPKNLGLVRLYYSVLDKGKLYQQVIADSDKLGKDEKDLWWVHSFRGSAKCKLGDKDAGLKEFVSALNIAFTAKDEVAANATIEQMVEAAGAASALGVVSKLPQAGEPRWMLTIAWLQWKNNDIASSRKTLDQVLPNLDKLADIQKEGALGFAGSIFMQTPDPDYARARDIFLQLLKLRPDDYRIFNNLACNPTVSPPESLDYSRKAYEKMTQQHVYEPLVADTYGWCLVQTGNEADLDQGLLILLDAAKAKAIPDVAYHLGKAYLQKNNATEAAKYLEQAQALFDQAIGKNEVIDVTLQQKIRDAQSEVEKRKVKRST